MLGAVRPDLIVAGVQIAVDTCPVEMPGHIHEGDARIIVLKAVHGGKIGIDPVNRIVRNTAAPLPHLHRQLQRFS